MNEKKTRRIIMFITKMLGSVSIRVLIIAILAIIFVFAIVRAYDFGYSVFTVKDTPEGETGEEVLVSITKDMTADDIADLLVKKRLIEDKLIFRIQTMLYTSEKYTFLPGTYMLNTTQSTQEMIGMMVGKKPVEETEAPHLWPEEGGTEDPGETSETDTSEGTSDSGETTSDN